MKYKAPLIYKLLCQDQAFPDKNFSDLKRKFSTVLSSKFLFLKFPSFFAFLIFVTIFAFDQSTLATVYFNCKAINQVEDDSCQNFTESTYLSENTVNNNTVSENTEVVLSEAELMIESDQFNAPVQVQTLREQREQIKDFTDNSPLELIHKNLDDNSPKKDSLFRISPQRSNEVVENNNLSDQAENSPQILVQEDRIDANDNLSESNSNDPELGTLLLQEIEPTVSSKKEKPLFYLIGNFGYMRSNNIFSGINPVDDNLFRTGVTLLALPSLSDQTSILASVGGNFVSYADQSAFDYDQLNLNLGIIHKFDDNFSGQFGWKNRYLFDGNNGTQFLNDNSLYVGINYKNPLTEDLTLNTGYQLQSNFSNPASRSQVINSLNIGLDYQIITDLKAGLNYQLALSNFTEQDRSDTYHELMGTLRYSLSPNTSLEMFLGHSFGDSSQSFIDYDGLIFGLGINVYLF